MNRIETLRIILADFPAPNFTQERAALEAAIEALTNKQDVYRWQVAGSDEWHQGVDWPNGARNLTVIREALGGMTAKGLAKLIEECGELQQIAGKRLAYYTTDEHPDGAGSLQQRMTDEMGDVVAAIQFCAEKFGIPYGDVRRRAASKLLLFIQWDADESNNEHAIDGSK